jgi:hypothetical protein
MYRAVLALCLRLEDQKVGAAGTAETEESEPTRRVGGRLRSPLVLESFLSAAWRSALRSPAAQQSL